MSGEIIIVGVGNSGVSLLDILALRRPDLKGLLAVNNDSESIRASVAHSKIEVPEGDPSEGFRAIDAAFGEAIGGAKALILCGGLGGESGSLLLPALAAHAKASGRIVLACVGLPFSLEGKDRRGRALGAVDKLRQLSDAVAVIDNERFSGGSAVSSNVGDAFRMADDFLAASVLALRGMLGTTGPVRIARNDLHAVLGPTGGTTHCAFGTASGENRLHGALEKALKGPLFLQSSKTSSLRSAVRVLLLLEGGNDISFAEVQTAVSEIERMTPAGCLIKTGVSTSGPSGSPLSISVFVSTETVQQAERSGAVDSGRGAQPSGTPGGDAGQASAKPAVSPAKGGRQAIAKPTTKAMQGTFDLETSQRGRFDKSEPTIIAGEDLDIPTFLRKGVKLPTPPRR